MGIHGPARVRARQALDRVAVKVGSSDPSSSSSSPSPSSTPDEYSAYDAESPEDDVYNVTVRQLEGLEWSGVADPGIGGGGGSGALSLPWVALLGDALALLVFAWIGRASHGSGAGTAGLLNGETLTVALPFLVGWFPAAYATGGLRRGAVTGGPAHAVKVALPGWALGVPAGIALRSIFLVHHVPPPAFCAVTLAATAVLLGGFRAAYAASPIAPKPMELGTRKGNPLELFRLLQSLTKRW